MQDNTEHELHSAVKIIAMDKAPGHDGVPIEFFYILMVYYREEFA